MDYMKMMLLSLTAKYARITIVYAIVQLNNLLSWKTDTLAPVS